MNFVGVFFYWRELIGCSPLVMAEWRPAGASGPHTRAANWRALLHVEKPLETWVKRHPARLLHTYGKASLQAICYPCPVQPQPGLSGLQRSQPVPPRPAQPGRACKQRKPDLYQEPLYLTWRVNGTEAKALRACLRAARHAPQPSQHGHCWNCHCTLSSAPGPSTLCKLCGDYQHSRHGAVRPPATWERYQRRQMAEYGRILPQPGYTG